MPKKRSVTPSSPSSDSAAAAVDTSAGSTVLDRLVDLTDEARPTVTTATKNHVESEPDQRAPEPKQNGKTRESRSAGGQLPRRIPVLLATLVIGSGVAAAMSPRPAGFAELTKAEAREKGRPVPQTQEEPDPPVAANSTNQRPLQEQLDEIRSTGAPRDISDLLLAVSEEKINAGNATAALPLIDEAVLLLRNDEQDPALLARAYYNKGWAELLAGNGKAAAEPLTQARAIRRKIGAPASQKAATLQLLVWAEREAGNNPGSVAVAKDLVAFVREEPKAADLATSLIGLGTSQVIAGDPAGGLTAFREAALLRKEKGGLAYAEALHAEGWATLGTKQRARAVAPLQEAVIIRRDLAPDSKDLSNSLLLLAWAEREGGNFPGAIEAQTELVELARKPEVGADLPSALEGLGVTQILSKQVGSSAEAVVNLTEATRLREGAPSAELAASLHLLGWAHIVDRRPTAAVPVLQRAIKIRKQLGLTTLAEQSQVLLRMANA